MPHSETDDAAPEPKIRYWEDALFVLSVVIIGFVLAVSTFVGLRELVISWVGVVFAVAVALAIWLPARIARRLHISYLRALGKLFLSVVDAAISTGW